MTPSEYNTSAQVFEEDLHNLAEFTFRNGPIQPRHLRLVSTIVRRWICDNEINTKIGRSLDIQDISAPILQDDVIFDQLSSTPNVVYYLSANVKFDGRPFSSLYHSTDKEPPQWVSTLDEARQGLERITRVRNKRVLHFRGESFRLEEVVRFAANKLGGAHLDHERNDRQRLLEEAANYASFGGPPDKLMSTPNSQLHFAVEPDSNEWMSAVHVVLVSSAAMLLNLHFDGSPFVEFDFSGNELSIGIPRLPRYADDGQIIVE